jgi:hypothetical protein
VATEVQVVRADDFPHGLRCGECCRVLRDGDPYAERWTGMMGEFPACMIVCAACDVPEVPGD